MAGKGRQANNARAAAKEAADNQETPMTSARYDVQPSSQLTPYQRMQGILESRSKEPALREISIVNGASLPGVRACA